MRRIPLALLAPIALGVTGLSIPAQLRLHESMTGPDWSHVWGPPYFTDDVANTDSYFGKVDRLNRVSWFHYSRGAVDLSPGTYRASAFIKKFSGVVGLADMHLDARFNGKIVRATTKQIKQMHQTWVALDPVEFTTTDALTRVSFVLFNHDGWKHNYLIDSFVLSRVAGPATQTMAPLHSWKRNASPNWSVVASGGSSFGQVLRAATKTGLGTVRLAAPGMTLAPGRYRANVRLRKTGTAAGAVPITLSVNTTPPKSVTVAPSAQTPNLWVMSKDLVFDLTAQKTLDFAVIGTGSSIQGYEFADFTLTKDGSYSVFGTGCRGSAGTPSLAGPPAPRIGAPFAVTLSNLPRSTAGVIATGFDKKTFGKLPLPFDLTAIGAPSCKLLISPDVILGITTGSTGSTTWGFSMPNDARLLG